MERKFENLKTKLLNRLQASDKQKFKDKTTKLLNTRV